MSYSDDESSKKQEINSNFPVGVPILDESLQYDQGSVFSSNLNPRSTITDLTTEENSLDEQTTFYNFIRANYDIRTTPMKSLEKVLLAKQSPAAANQTLYNLRRLKLFLKRQHAKARNQSAIIKEGTIFFDKKITQRRQDAVKAEQTIFKQKKNRVAAQFSRDKHRYYVASLEADNAQLRTRLTELEEEVQKLKYILRQEAPSTKSETPSTMLERQVTPKVQTTEMQSLIFIKTYCHLQQKV